MVLKGQKLEVHDEKEPKLTVLMNEDLKQEATDTTGKKKMKNLCNSVVHVSGKLHSLMY